MSVAGSDSPDATGVSVKLVRDYIPQIVRATGQEPIIEVADEALYRQLLRTKLLEEAHEFIASDDIEELADVLEVVQALVLQLGADPERLEQIRKNKARDRGGFSLRLVWKGNLPG